MNFIAENINIISLVVDILGIVVIVVSVLFLAKQTIQANILAQGDSEREMFDSFNELINRYSDLETVELIQRGLHNYKNLPKKEKARFSLVYFIPHINFLDQVLGLYKKNLLNQDRFNVSANVIIAILKTPGGLQAWNEIKKSYRQSFVEFVNLRLSNSMNLPPITEIMTGFQIEDQNE